MNMLCFSNAQQEQISILELMDKKNTDLFPGTYEAQERKEHIGQRPGKQALGFHKVSI